MRALRPVPLLVLVIAACAPDLRDDHPFDGQSSEGPLVKTELQGSLTTMVVDATDKNSQVYVDLDEAREMKVDEAFDTNGWDLSFKRFTITTNGGSGNPSGAVAVAVLKGVDFDGLTTAPATGFQRDAAETVFNGVEGGWYYYDLGVHRLITRDELTYVVRTSTGAHLKLKLLSYYDAAGTPAVVSLKFAPVAAPASPAVP